MARTAHFKRSRLALASSVALGISLVGPAAPAGAAPFTVTKTADTADGTCDADCSLREAIIAANLDAVPDDITVPAGTYLLTLGDLNVIQPVTITGAGATTTIIDSDVPGERVISVGAATTISGVTVTGGTRDPGGGGGISSTAPLTLDGVAVKGNVSAGGGGGISAADDATAAVDLTVTDSEISGNTAGVGGGGAGSGGIGVGALASAVMENVTVSGNQAETGGGGIGSGGATSAILNNVTITGNVADADGNGTGDGGGLAAGASTTISNTIVAGNTEEPAAPASDDCTGSPTSADYNLIGNATDCGFTGLPNDEAGTSATPIDPLLAPLALNPPGLTQTHAFQSASSPALNEGNPAAVGAVPACEATDQRGVTRPQGPACDIGAFEAGVGDVGGPSGGGPGGGPGDGAGAIAVVKCKGKTATKVGTEGRDTLKGSKKKDVMAGLGGKDKLSGKGKKDRLCGGLKNDRLRGGAGNDLLVGGKGKRDRCVGGPGTDKARGCEIKKSIP